ncbi:MAG: histidinol-phosphate transaminase [Pseudomonadota bacterium]
MPSGRPNAYITPLSVRERISRAQPKGLPLINMGFNELPYPPSDAVLAAINATTARANAYGNPTCAALRDALGEVNSIDPGAIICGNGSEELLDVIGRCFARPGDEILIPEFGYIQFPIVANRVGADLVKVPERDYRTDVDAILEAVTSRTRIVFLANPNNPTGTMVPAAELSRLAAGLPGNVILVLDLAYGEFAGFDYCASTHGLVAEHDNVIVTRTFSKAFGLAGLRVGWLHAPDWMTPVLYAGRGMGTVNAAAQAGALAALEEIDLARSRVAEILSERERVTAALSGCGLSSVPSSTNFLMTGFPRDDGTRAEALTVHFFEDAGIIVNRTREAGLEGFLRFSLSLPEHNDLLLKSAQRFISAGG